MKTDVCLILEGTYPFVHGGVSSWVHKLVTSLSDVKFSIIHVSATGDIIKTPKYELPDNILEFKEVFIHDFINEKGRTHGSKDNAWKTLSKFYNGIAKGDFSSFHEVYDNVINLNKRSLNTNDLMFSKKSWKLMTELYNKYAGGVSFVDFYWTMRFIHRPIVGLLRTEIPDADLYHTVCTGYAGLLGILAKIKNNKPLLLTEHGIYTYERKIEISNAKWIHSDEEPSLRASRTLGFFKDAWIKKFEILSRLTYDYADKIITLFEGNKRMQMEYGARPEKISVVSNGVDIDANLPLTAKERRHTNNIGFVGRVVSIKDVKTLIRAMKVVKDSIPDAILYVMGSGDEEPEYFEECKVLSEMLGLEDGIIFTENVDVKDYYPNLDIVVLTSISEAQPLSLLEAMSYGIPVVASDVGACRELVLGKDEEDANLGPSGKITNVGNAYETANAIIETLKNKELWEQFSASGVKRVKKYYKNDSVIDSYRDMYESFLSGRK